MSFRSWNTNTNEKILSVLSEATESHECCSCIAPLWLCCRPGDVTQNRKWSAHCSSQTSCTINGPNRMWLPRGSAPKLIWSETLVKLSATETPNNTDQTPAGCLFTWPCHLTLSFDLVHKTWLAWGSFPKLSFADSVNLQHSSDAQTNGHPVWFFFGNVHLNWSEALQFVTVRYEAMTTGVIA